MHMGIEGCLVLMKEDQSVVCCPDKWRSEVRIYLSTGMRRSRANWSVRLLVRTEGYASLGTLLLFTLYNSVILSIGTETLFSS